MTIEYVFGAKGSGKTKVMIDMANLELEEAKGFVIFVNDRDRYRVKVNKKIRFIDVAEYNLKGADELYGFICGLLSSNYDITAIFLDNFMRIIDANSFQDVEQIIKRLENLPFSENVKLVISISCDEKDVPKFMKS